MHEIKIFENEEFGQIRTLVDEDGTILFCGSDVAKALGYGQPHKAIERHCRYGMKRTIPHPQNIYKNISMLFIKESGVYRLIMKSKLPSAEQFEQWVCEEVLPSIRKHGAYITMPKLEEIMANPDSLELLLKQQQRYY